MDRLDSQFEILKDRYLRYLIAKYKAIDATARDKEYLKEFILGLVLLTESLSNNPYKEELITAFNHYYRMGYSMEKLFVEIPAIKERHAVLMEEAEKEVETTVAYKNFLYRLLGIPDKISKTSRNPYLLDRDFIHVKNEKELMKFFVRHASLLEFKEFLNKQPEVAANKELQAVLTPVYSEKESLSKIKRSRNDGITKLSLEQTALLIYFLRQSKIILGESYLSKQMAAEAFEILTGYSRKTLRPELSNLSLDKTNLKDLQKAITELNRLIEKELKDYV